jgi:hypothetical protein
MNKLFNIIKYTIISALLLLAVSGILFSIIQIIIDPTFRVD